MRPLRILVYPHSMELGGSQLNAIELAAAVRQLGHDVVVIGEDGSLVNLVRQLGMEHLPLDSSRRRPSVGTAAKLRSIMRERQLDIIHGYEWPPGIEAAAATFPGDKVAAVCTVMSMAVAPFIPRHLPLVVGTRELQEVTARRRPGPVHLIEPPVDVVKNAPGHPDDEFRARFGLGEEAFQGRLQKMTDIVMVCRLVPELKLEGILAAINVVGKLGQSRPIRLIIVGDGTARATVEQYAARANIQTGRRAVVLTGELFDPRPAYAAADVMLGMGGSALRALAFARPLIVQGERGFWKLLTPQTRELFLAQGWYGIGDGGDGEALLTEILANLVDDPTRREELGGFGRALVVKHFSLDRAAQIQVDIYESALAKAANRSRLSYAMGEFGSTTGVFAHKVRRRYQRVRGTMARDDFNAVARAAVPPLRERR